MTAAGRYMTIGYRRIPAAAAASRTSGRPRYHAAVVNLLRRCALPLRPRAQELLFAGLVLHALVVGLDRTPFDDSFFFKRFALNFLAHGRFAWNLEDGPVHGNSSQLFQVLATGLTALTRDHYVVAARIALAAALGGAFALLASRVRARGGLPEALWPAFCAPITLAALHTGMETAVLWLVLASFYRLVLLDPAGELRPVRAAALTALVYLTRPDATLLPVVAIAWVHGRRQPRRLVVYAATLVALLGLLLAGFHFYYGSALPLPFYWKTFGLSAYDPAFVQAGVVWKRRYLLTFLVFAAPLTWVALHGRAAPARGLVASALALVLYHRVMTNEVMGYHARFYLPALLPLGLAAALAWSDFRARERRAATALFAALHAVGTLALYAAGQVETGAGGHWVQVPLGAYLLAIALAAWLLLLHGRLPASGVAAAALALGLVLAAFPPRRPALLSDQAFLAQHGREVTSVRGLDDVKRCLPEPLQVYHSEIGAPGLELPRSRITDLAGLMSNQLTFAHPPFDLICLHDRPEVLFLPHRGYVALNREILAGSCIRGYTNVEARSSSPLYIRNDLVAGFLVCARPELSP
jgi:hypothetical protein